MVTSSFIPIVWSETLLSELDREYIAVRNCSRDFDGEIKGKGNSVRIAGIDDIIVSDYSVNEDMLPAQPVMSNGSRTLYINQVKFFHFQIDDVERAQSQPNLMKTAMRHAAMALADVADKYVYSLYTEATSDNTITVDTISADKIIDAIIEARQMLYLNGVNSNTETSLEVSPAVASFILRAKLLNSTDNSAILENGLLGKLFGFNIYVSPNIARDTDGRHKCFVRTKRAIAFAEQLSEVEAYRPEMRFSDAVKGLHLYGAKVIYPKELIILDIAA